MVLDDAPGGLLPWEVRLVLRIADAFCLREYLRYVRAIVYHATVGVTGRAESERVLTGKADLRWDVVARRVKVHHHHAVGGPLLNSLHVR